MGCGLGGLGSQKLGKANRSSKGFWCIFAFASSIPLIEILMVQLVQTNLTPC